MSDSKSLDSLLSLAESHMSKISLSADSSQTTGLFVIPKLGGTSESDVWVLKPENRFIIPALNSGGTMVSSVVTKQVANTLRARELKLQKEMEEKEANELKEKMNKLKLKEEVVDTIIDFTEALNEASMLQASVKKSFNTVSEVALCEAEKPKDIKPTLPKQPPRLSIVELRQDRIRSPTHFEFNASLWRNFGTNFKGNIPRSQIKREPSNFARAFCKRYRPYKPPCDIVYVTQVSPLTIKRFVFDTPSPDDIAAAEELERAKNPPVYDIFQILGVPMSDSLLARTDNST